MEIDPPPSSPPSNKQKADSLYELATGNLSTTLSKLSSSSKSIPPDKEFHFFNNFKEFKLPVKEINSKSKSLLSKIDPFKGKTVKDNFFDDGDDAYNWLVDFNDDVFERMDVDIDEFERLRKLDEETGGVALSGMEDDGFQLVTGRNSKRNRGGSVTIDLGDGSGLISGVGGESKVKVADKKTVGGKAKVPFHIPTIPRPQDQYKILVNNANTPFQHVWLQRSEDDSKFIHPLEELCVLDFVDRNLGDGELLKPPPLEGVPFKLVEEVKDLKELAAKLRSADEFAVDLEHNQYRSFQGLTCLMQISTRTEDFVIDTLKLRIHIGPYLREVFKDPLKKKVMHGADRDIIWLQRDFGIYVCNLFDTGQASRVLKLERNSLEYLLNHFCEVAANKEYQNADWRLRPLPAEMMRYAREDTHYLLHIYDLMRKMLLSMPKDSENSGEPIVEVYKRSYDVCMQLYEKELLTDDSYLHIYGLQAANFNAQQLAVVAALSEWRDVIAREEDESTGYILPNKSLLEIAKQMPVTANKLRNLVKSKHPYVERSIGAVVSIIRHAIQNSSAFEAVAVQLKEGRSELMRQAPGEAGAANGAEDLSTLDNATADLMDVENTENRSKDGKISMANKDGSSLVATDRTGHDTDGVAKIKIEKDTKVTDSISIHDTNAGTSLSRTAQVTGASVQVLKKPSRGFGALLGNASQKKKIDLATKEKEVNKLEQIKSSVTLPFHSFSGKDENLKHVAEKQKDMPIPPQDPQQIVISSNTALGDVISLEDDSAVDEPQNAEQEPICNSSEQEKSSWISDSDEPMSLSELSSNFKKCLQSSKQPRIPKQAGTSQEAAATVQIEPFDYEAARQQVKFGGHIKEADTEDGGIRPRFPVKNGKKISSEKTQAQREDESGGFAPGKRRQAFPASGNRSATFRSSK